MGVLVGGEQFDEELLESVRCPSCGERIDLTGEDVDRKTSFALSHISECVGGGSTSISRDGWQVGDEVFTVDELRPLTSPGFPERQPGPEEIAERMEEKDWSGGLGEDGVVRFDGLTEEGRYVVDPGSGKVYGEGPLKGRIEEFVENFFRYYKTLKEEGKL